MFSCGHFPTLKRFLNPFFFIGETSSSCIVIYLSIIETMFVVKIQIETRLTKKIIVTRGTFITFAGDRTRSTAMTRIAEMNRGLFRLLSAARSSKRTDFWRRKEPTSMSHRNSCFNCSGAPKTSRHNGHLIVFSPVETWWSSQTFIHLTWTLFPHPCLWKERIDHHDEEKQKIEPTDKMWSAAFSKGTLLNKLDKHQCRR